ncbi:hypothetical protein J3R82DRAFT_2348 [Butyriboletus roseoflavus]|nr:hypothetical protein J3R82DRAFT_2348 [Butyriboletus roseoflavus]
MPRFPNRTVVVAVNPLSPDDDEDNDICPVCDGDCTCNNRPRPILPSSVSHGGARFVATPTASTVSSVHARGAQPLKIKLIVPPSIQNQTRSVGSAPKRSRMECSSAASSGVAGSSSASSHLTTTSSTACHGQLGPSGAIGQKRKGRPPRAVTIVRDGAINAASDWQIRGNEVNTLPQSQSHLSSHTYTRRSIVSRAHPQIETLKPNSSASRQTSKSQAKGTTAKRSASSKKKQDSVSDLTDSDLQPSIDTFRDDDGDDVSSGRFPTFVSADGLTSEASDSSDSDSDSDTSGFGSDSSLAAEEENYIVAEQRRHEKARIRRELLGDDVPKHKDSNNSWVIRPRKKSVGLSDVDMDGDTDDITEEDEDEDEEMEEEDEDDETDGQASRVYTGLATGWSDDEESSFDADLFFANLTDTLSDDSSSDTDGSHLHDSAMDPLAQSATSLRSVDIEVTEVWDGQVVFTNGSNDGHGVLDLAFEANAAQLLASDSASISHDSDVEMYTSDGAEGDFDDGDSELGASDGETTEEELVDEQGLPTSRAMRLFRSPTSVSSINPMSTVSPTVSPAPFSRRHPPPTIIESPRPADILAGRVFWEDPDHSHQDGAEGGLGDCPRPITPPVVPVMGQFSLEGNAPQKTAVLTGINKDVPSPYPRLGHRRRRFSSSAGSFSSMDLRGRTARLSIYPSLPPPSDQPSSEVPPDIGLGEPIKLDDVLDSTFLDSEPETQIQTVRDSEGEQKLVQSLSRWDRVPVGAFRLTRESAASTSDVPTSPGWASEPAKFSPRDARSYGNALKSSPLHTMLWHDKSAVKEKPRKSGGVTISPVLLPVRDGTRTPPHAPYHYDLHSNHHQQEHTPYKNRKESRREMKMMKRKTHPPIHKHYDQRQRHHRRNHHPNMKSRGNASVQRTFFSSPTSAPGMNV